MTKLGRYTLTRRTPYSKVRIFDYNKNNLLNFTATKKMAEIIIDEYESQLRNKETYFKFGENTCVLDCIKLNKINTEYIFVPDNVENILGFCFANSNVRLISLPDSVEEMGESVFRNCKELREVIIPKKIEEINENTFLDCFSLKYVEFPENLKEIKASAFDGCRSLTDIVFPDTVRIIGSYAFARCASLKKINIPRDFEGFGEYPFDECNIETIRFNHDLKDAKNPKWAYGDFIANVNVKKLEISKNVSHIDPLFFEYNTIKKTIKEIHYKGTRPEFEEFRKNNEVIFDYLHDVEIHTFDTLENEIDEEKNIKDIEKENKTSSIDR